VWIPDSADVWKLATIVETDENGYVTVQPVVSGPSECILSTYTHMFDPSHESDLDDAALLNNLHEAPLLNLITSRFKRVHFFLFFCRPH